MSESIGFIGLGTMGGPMARNLMRAGKRLIVHDIRPEAARSLCAGGAIRAGDFRAMRREADIVVTSLPGPPEIEQVAFGEEGLIAALGAGALWIDTSTSRASLARRLAALCREAGSAFVDAPVTGGAAGAREATLKIMAGGDAADLARARSVLEVIGSTLVHTGATGTGCAMKLVLNFLSFTGCAVTAEALVLGRASGLSSETLLAVLSGSYGDSAMLGNIMQVADGGRAWDFSAGLARKDVALAVELAGELGLSSRFGAAILGLFDECIADPDAPDDAWSLIEGFERRAGVSIL